MEHKSAIHRKPRIRSEKTILKKKPEERVYHCEVCGEEFKSRLRALKHKKVQHGKKKEEINKCKLCGETFENNLKFLIHKNKHTAQKMTKSNEKLVITLPKATS